MLPKSWKKSFNSGIIIPTKMRLCNQCSVKECLIDVKIKLTEMKNSKAIKIC